MFAQILICRMSPETEIRIKYSCCLITVCIFKLFIVFKDIGFTECLLKVKTISQFFSWFIWSQTYCYLQLESYLITSIWKKAFWRFERRRVACTMAEISKYSPNIKVYILWEGHKNEQNHPGDLTFTKFKKTWEILSNFRETNQQKSVIVPFLECQSPIRFNWFEQTFQCLNISTK